MAMKQYIWWIVAGVLIAGVLYLNFSDVSGLKELDANAFETAVNSSAKHILLDVREPAELDAGYIEGAVNIPLGQLAGRLQEVPKDQPVYLYCRSGRRSQEAAKILLDNGYKDVSHLNGGINAWTGPLSR